MKVDQSMENSSVVTHLATEQQDTVLGTLIPHSLLWLFEDVEEIRELVQDSFRYTSLCRFFLSGRCERRLVAWQSFTVPVVGKYSCLFFYP